jgi:release factor glutamine methyltransferase
MTIEQEYKEFKKKLETIYDDRESENITELIFEHVTGKKRWERRINGTNELDSNISFQLQKHLHELLTFKPAQYILNEAWYYKRKYYVNENVLIPRPETEELVEWLVSDLRNLRNNISTSNLKILDIGTGSGCIAISIKKELKYSDVFAIDVSEHALVVARKNAGNLQAKIKFLIMDFLDENSWDSLDVFDIIVSNPPYIPESEKEKMKKNVTDFEPAKALFVKNHDLFIFYKKIAKFAQSFLNTSGNIYVEINEAFSKEVQEIFTLFNLDSVIKKDIYGKERMIRATKKENP